MKVLGVVFVLVVIAVVVGAVSSASAVIQYIPDGEGDGELDGEGDGEGNGEEQSEERSEARVLAAAAPVDDTSTDPGDLLCKTAVAFPSTVARSLRNAILQEVPARRWEFNMAYEDIEYLDVRGHSWLFTGGYERTYSPWGWGVLVPIQRWSLSGYEEFWQVGVVPYAFTVVKDVVRVGGFVEVDRTNSDIEGLGDETSWATGVFASGLFALSDTVTLTPVGLYEHYWTGQDPLKDSNLFTLGPKLDFALSEKFYVGVFGFFTLETTNDEIDGSYWEYGMILTYLIKETWGLSFGYQGISGAQDLDYDKFILGAHLNF